jgi:dipeptidyl aminopeptidase/acylaminoacyl peptidase
MRAILLLAILASAGRLAAQAPPASDIWLVDVSVRGGRLRLGTAVNVTSRPGYDNQPAFLPDGSALIYTRVGEDGQADIWRCDVASHRSEQVTTTPESEYSPTPLAGQTGFSVVRVERDSTQRLWRFAPPAPPELVFEHIAPVGYHAWATPTVAALYLLGEPSALVIANASTGRVDTMARDIGRSLQAIPGRPAVSFVQWVGRREPWLTEVDVTNRAVLPLVRMPGGAEFHVWTPHGLVLAAVDSKLYQWDPLSGGSWKEIANLRGAGLRGITRLAVSPSGDRLAIVAVPSR